MNPYVILVFVGLGVGGIGWGGRLLYKAGYDAAKVEAVQTQDVIRETAQKSQEAAATEIAKIQVKHVTIRQTLEKELTRDVLYRECRATDGVLQLTNQALTGGADAAADRIVPAPNPAR